MRFLRALFLTAVAVLLIAGLLVVQVGASLGLTILNPGFVLNAMDRVGIYQLVRDTTIAALAPPEGAKVPQDAQLVVAAASEALTPDVLRQAMHEVLPQLFRLIKDPGAPPELKVNLAGFREPFVAALVRMARERNAPAETIDQIRREINRQIPDTVNVIEQMHLEIAPLRVVAGYYVTGVRVLLAVCGVLAVLVLLCVAAGRRAWKPWVGVPLVLSGITVVALGVAGRWSGLPALVESLGSGLVLPSTVDRAALLGALQGLGNEVLRTATIVGAATALMGLVLVSLHRLARRMRRASGHRAARPVVG
ncbi:MAG: hypothetical protein Q8P31_12550 [Bacillota bacterium]|nr:hypothetical protein [Bacillota bacterium]